MRISYAFSEELIRRRKAESPMEADYTETRKIPSLLPSRHNLDGAGYSRVREEASVLRA